MKKRFPTVMIVEDEPRIMKQLAWEVTSIFKRQVQILKAMTYRIGHEIIEEGLPDISLLDIGLPDGHGEDLIVTIREKSRTHPIIVQTTVEDKDYQLKLYKKYGRLYYVTKNVLFQEIRNILIEAKVDWEQSYESKRLAIHGLQEIDSLSADEVCCVMTAPEIKGLLVEFYDFKLEDYRTAEIKNMTLTQFMNDYNKERHFIRCHNSYIVNKKMIEKVSRADNYILLLYKRASNNEVRVDMGEGYKKDVLTQMKGLY